jgi:hypothetical protein
MLNWLAINKINRQATINSNLMSSMVSPMINHTKLPWTMPQAKGVKLLPDSSPIMPITQLTPQTKRKSWRGSLSFRRISKKEAKIKKIVMHRN